MPAGSLPGLKVPECAPPPGACQVPPPVGLPASRSISATGEVVVQIVVVASSPADGQPPCAIAAKGNRSNGRRARARKREGIRWKSGRPASAERARKLRESYDPDRISSAGSARSATMHFIRSMNAAVLRSGSVIFDHTRGAALAGSKDFNEIYAVRQC